MRKGKILISAVIAALILSIPLSSAAKNTKTTAEISVSAEAAVLYEPTTKSLLFTKNANKRLPMASTTKIMTALVALENSEPTDKVIIDERAYGIEGSSAYLALGSEYTMQDMLYALLLQSANDAAIAIAYTVSGEVDAFVELMNEKCLELGLTDTHFDNPNGLDSETHYTTARELALIAAAAMENEQFCEIAGSYKKHVGEGSNGRLFVNHNKLLKMYDGCVGIKTGFTKKCGRCLVSAAEREGLTFIAVTLDAPNDWADHKRMLDYGYSRLKCLTLAEALEYEYDIPLLSSDKGTVKAGNTEGLRITVPTDFPEVESYIKLSRFTAAPIKRGDVLGTVVFTADGEVIGSVDIVALEDAVPIKEKKNLFELIKGLFK